MTFFFFPTFVILHSIVSVPFVFMSLMNLAVFTLRMSQIFPQHEMTEGLHARRTSMQSMQVTGPAEQILKWGGWGAKANT